MIRIFYHIFCNEYTDQIVKDQISKLVFSGLYERCDVIHCFLVGPFMTDIANRLRTSGTKFSIEVMSSADSTGERLTLTRIKSFVKDGDKILYMHTKGVGRAAQAFADPQTRKDVLSRLEDWRTFMEYHLFAKHQECLKALDTVDAVGVNWRYWDVPLMGQQDLFPRSNPLRHFSGNMWWCTATYWNKLPESIGTDYLAPEMHIGIENPRILCLAESMVDHYKEKYPLCEYI